MLLYKTKQSYKDRNCKKEKRTGRNYFWKK